MYHGPCLNLANFPTFLIHIENCRVNLLLHPLLISRPKSGGPWPFIPPARLEVIRQHISPLSFKGPDSTRAARFALVGLFGFRHKSSRGRHHYPAGTPQNKRGRAVPFGLVGFWAGHTPKKLFIHFFCFSKNSPQTRG